MSFAYITEEGAYIKKRGERFVVGRNQEIVMEIPGHVLEGLVLIDSVQVSSAAMVALLRLGVPVTWISRRGKFFGRLESTQHVHVERQVRQIALQGSDLFLQFGKKVVAAKVHNQLTILRRYNRRAQVSAIDTAIQNILAMRKNIFLAEDASRLMGHEGIIARVYFEAMGKLMPEAFTFDRRSRQPPLDEVNSMLSFGYTLLMYEVYTALTLHGLHPYFGFLHALRNHHPALASDLMEEWRAAVVDSLVLSLIHHHEILPAHFERDEEGAGIYLTRVGRQIFLSAYERKMRTVNRYMAGECSYRQSLPKQAERFAQAMMAGEEAGYEPLFLR